MRCSPLLHTHQRRRICADIYRGDTARKFMTRAPRIRVRPNHTNSASSAPCPHVEIPARGLPRVAQQSAGVVDPAVSGVPKNRHPPRLQVAVFSVAAPAPTHVPKAPGNGSGVAGASGVVSCVLGGTGDKIPGRGSTKSKRTSTLKRAVVSTVPIRASNAAFLARSMRSRCHL